LAQLGRHKANEVERGQSDMQLIADCPKNPAVFYFPKPRKKHTHGNEQSYHLGIPCSALLLIDSLTKNRMFLFKRAFPFLSLFVVSSYLFSSVVVSQVCALFVTASAVSQADVNQYAADFSSRIVDYATRGLGATYMQQVRSVHSISPHSSLISSCLLASSRPVGV
jgi:hypothetical protein